MAARSRSFDRLARDLIDRTAQSFDGLAAVSPDTVARDLADQARALREIRVRFAGPPAVAPNAH